MPYFPRAYDNIICNIPPVFFKKKKIWLDIFFWFLTCQAPNPTTHLTITLSYLLWPAHFLLLLSFFFFFFIFGRTLSSLLQTLLAAPPYHHFHHHFSSKITGKFLRTHKHLHILFFEAKISHLFGGFCTFAWGYFYLSFNNDTHMIYKHRKWYLCVFMYGFCIGGIIWWVSIWFVLMITT